MDGGGGGVRHQKKEQIPKTFNGRNMTRVRGKESSSRGERGDKHG